MCTKPWVLLFWSLNLSPVISGKMPQNQGQERMRAEGGSLEFWCSLRPQALALHWLSDLPVLDKHSRPFWGNAWNDPIWTCDWNSGRQLWPSLLLSVGQDGVFWLKAGIIKSSGEQAGWGSLFIACCYRLNVCVSSTPTFTTLKPNLA